jgi:hypothetical protein
MAKRELELPYVPVDPGIETSERMGLYLDALDAVDDEMAPWHVVKLLLWIGKNRADGNLGKMSDKTIAKFAGWKRDPQVLVNALVLSGWLIKVKDGYRLEGWERHGGKLIAERERYRQQEREKKARYRARKKGADVHVDKGVDVPGTVHDVHRNECEYEDHHIHTGANVSTGTSGVYPAAGTRLTIDDIRMLVSNPPRCWPFQGRNGSEARLLALCPVDGDKVAEALRTTETEATKPCIEYFATTLEGLCRKTAKKKPTPKRDIRVGYADVPVDADYSAPPGMRTLDVT